MRITGSGGEEAQARLQAVADRLRNLRPVIEVVAQDTKSLIDDSFQHSSSPSGAPWAPLSAATRRINPRRIGGKPLVDTARLRNSITTTTGPTGFAFGTNVRYGGPHQFGARIRTFGRGKERGLVARPFLPIEPAGGRYSLMSGGRAGVHWTHVRAAVALYIRTGNIE